MHTKTKDALIVFCECGCETGFTFRYLFGEIYVSTEMSLFHALQAPFRAVLKKSAQIAFTKNKTVTGIIVKENDVNAIIQWLQQHPCESVPRPQQNHSQLELIPIINELDTEHTYELCLNAKIKPIDLLKGKLYQTGDIAIHENHRKKLLYHLQEKQKEIIH